MTSSELHDPTDDGLAIPNVGEHSRDKHHFLRRYIDAFTVAMQRKGWVGLHYIDLFAGAGIERLERSNRLSWGSPLIAAQAVPQFSRLHLCEMDSLKFDALVRRIERIDQPNPSQLICGDANQCVTDILACVPDRTLTLAFLDPYGLHVHFETLRHLSTKRTDLIVYFPDRVDALRNWESNYLDNPSSNLDLVLGQGADWRSIFKSESRNRWIEKLRDLYVSQITTLGYQHFEYERIFANGQPIYQLIFCSRHELGAKIWRGIANRKPDDQRTFDFGGA